MPYYLQPQNVGIQDVYTLGDGKTMEVSWFRAQPTNKLNSIAYNIYVSDNVDTLYYEGPKYISFDDLNSKKITTLIPGKMYYFSVRPVEYSAAFYDLSQLPSYGGLNYYPESVLREDLTNNGLIVKMIDTSEFPSSGFIKIGNEIIRYSSNDTVNNNLNISSLGDRGINSLIRKHDIDGYDGYYTQNPVIKFYVQGESDLFDRIYKNQSKFAYPEYPYTNTDGYKQVTSDILTTDLSASFEINKDFPYQDYRGYRRLDMASLFSGNCVGSYIGGEQYCADGYSGVGRTRRGFNLAERNNQNQEEILQKIGIRVVLLQRDRVGVRCNCFTLNRESPLSKCEYCFGTGFVVGYSQYFNNRESDGRILIRMDPANEELKSNDTGYESTFITGAWTLTVPTIKDRDIIIVFGIDDVEEFRYEVLEVSRNKLTLGAQGAQKFRMQRIRKTDPIYQIPYTKDVSTQKRTVLLEFGGNAAVPSHTHEIVLSEKITNISQINQLTSMSLGHRHIIRNGIIVGTEGDSSLKHTHTVKLIWG